MMTLVIVGGCILIVLILIIIARENKFLTMPEYKRAKGDVKKDKAVSGFSR